MKKNKNFRKKLETPKDILIYGKQPVLFAIKNKTRSFKQIYVTQNSFSVLNDFCRKNLIKLGNIVKVVDKDFLNGMFKEETNTQGFVALVGDRKFLSLEDFIKKFCNTKDLPRLLLLDSITDPHNVGAILRTAAAFGVNNVITTSFNSVKDGGIIVKSSAGMSELINFIEVVNLNNTIKDLQKCGYFVVGLAGEAKEDIKDISSRNLALVLGSEGKGIRPLVKQNCDSLAKIAMKEDVESLNVSVASGIAMYAVWGNEI